SFWILDGITPLRQIDPTAAQPATRLFTPAPAYRVRPNTNTDTPLPPDEPFAENPPDGAILDFFRSEANPSPVTLEILDAKGKLVRRYSSTDEPAVTEADLKTLDIPEWWVRISQVLPASAGMHRWIWDLHYTPPESLRHEYPIAAVPHRTPRLPRGPRALPGI